MITKDIQWYLEASETLCTPIYQHTIRPVNANQATLTLDLRQMSLFCTLIPLSVSGQTLYFELTCKCNAINVLQLKLIAML